jgi:transcriptional regulator with XRE-family HTH domain
MSEPVKITQQDVRIGKRIAKLRRERGFTQERLAERIGVSLTWIGYIETAKRRPNIKMLYRLSKALQVDPGELLP